MSGSGCQVRERSPEELKSKGRIESSEREEEVMGKESERVFSLPKYLWEWPDFESGVLMSSLCCSYSQVAGSDYVSMS